MTPRQAQLYRFISSFIAQTGEAPTYPEMSEALNFNSHGSLHNMLSALVKRGKLIRIPLKKRGLKLASQPPTPICAVAFRVEDEKLIERFVLTPAGWVAR